MTIETLTLETLETLPVKIEYVAEVPFPWGEDKTRTVDQWRVTLTSKAGYHALDYFTGMGLRTRTYSGSGRKWDAMRKKHYDDKPKKPKVADVLHSLIMDANAADENFDDWCDNYGCSSDSIKALNTYKACLDTARALRKHLSPDALRQVRELLQDY